MDSYNVFFLKKRLKKIAFVLTVLIIICSIFVCIRFGFCSDSKKSKNDNHIKGTQQENGFYYYINLYDYEQESAVILGLVDENKEIDELVIPEKLGGCPVVAVGERRELKDYVVNAKNVKRIIINHDVDLSYGVINFKGDLIINTRLTLSHFYDWYDIDTYYDKENNRNEVLKGIHCIIYKYECAEEELIIPKRCTYKVFFDATGGEQSVWTIAVLKERMLTNIEEPQKEGYKFGGWYKEETLENEWSFKDIVTENMTLYAKWIEI